jgi:hypothetical protein
MSKKMMLLATALTALAFAALPAVASAGEPQTHCTDLAASCVFTVHGEKGALNTAGAGSVNCSTTTGSGTMGTTTGTMTLLYHGCTESVFGSACTTSPEASGTIKTTPLIYHNIYVSAGKSSPGVLVTPNATSGVFAHFVCAGGLVTKTITGNGLVGTLISPKCGGDSNVFEFAFEQSAAGTQKHMQITGAGTLFDLKDGSNTGSLVATAKATLTSTTASLTCV